MPTNPSPISKDFFDGLLNSLQDLTDNPPDAWVRNFLDPSGQITRNISDVFLGDDGLLTNFGKKSKDQTSALLCGPFDKATTDMLSDWGMDPAVIQRWNEFIKHSRFEAFPWDQVLCLVRFVATFVKISGATLDGITPHIRRKTADLVRGDNLDPSSLVTYLFKTDDKNKYVKLLGHLGIDKDWREVLEKSHRPIPTLIDAMQLRNRGVIDDPTLAKLFKANGYEPKTASEGLLKLRHPLLDVNTVGELWRRTKGEKPHVKKYLDSLGYVGGASRDLLDSFSTLRPLGVLYEQHRRGKINIQEVAEGIKRLGFEEDRYETMSDMWNRPFDLPESRVLAWRKIITPEQFRNNLKWLGYDKGQVKALEDASEVLATPTDLVRFGVRDIFTPDVAKKFRLFDEFPDGILSHARRIGMQPETMKMYWAAHWDLPAVGQGFQMFHRGIIDYPTLQLLLKAKDVNPFWRTKLIGLSYNVFSRRVIDALVKNKVITFQRARSAFADIGFSPEDARLMAVNSVKKRVASEKKATKSEVLRWYRRDQITRAKAIDFLLQLGFDVESLNFLLADIQLKKDEDALLAQKTLIDRDAALARDLSRGDILKGLRDGFVTLGRARELLAATQYSPEAVDFLVTRELFNRDLDDREHLAKHTKRLFDRGIITNINAIKSLRNGGMTDPQANRLVGLWSVERSADLRIEQNPDEKPTRAVLMRWLERGIINGTEFVSGMRNLGWNNENIARFLTESIEEATSPG